MHVPCNQIYFNYSLHQQTLEQVRFTKYLGLTITDNLEWGQHVSETSCITTMTMGFLQRNLAFAPRNSKEAAYKTLIHPQLEYAATIWHPYYETETKKVEKVQKTELGGPAGHGETPVVSITCLTNLSGNLWRTTGWSPP